MPHIDRLSFDDKIYAPYKLATLVDTVAEMGIGAKTALARTGLKPEDLRNPSVKTSVRQLVQACRNVIEENAAPDTGFRVGMRMHISSYGMYGYALLCCETLRDVTQLAVKYHRLATPTVAMSFREEDGEAVWSFDNIVDLDPSDPLYRFLVEVQYGIHTVLGRDLLGPAFVLTKVRARYAAPPHRVAYRRHLGGTAEFNQPVDELRYAASLLDRPLTYRNPLTAAMVTEVCERLLEDARRETGIASSVYRLLMQVPGRFDDLETLASRLDTTARTLRRRLQQEGTSYQEILAEVRCRLAKEYLRTTRMTTEDIAEMLGFSESANFRHAFKRWTGKAPSDFRR